MYTQCSHAMCNAFWSDFTGYVWHFRLSSVCCFVSCSVVVWISVVYNPWLSIKWHKKKLCIGTKTIHSNDVIYEHLTLHKHTPSIGNDKHWAWTSCAVHSVTQLLKVFGSFFCCCELYCFDRSKSEKKIATKQQNIESENNCLSYLFLFHFKTKLNWNEQSVEVVNDRWHRWKSSHHITSHRFALPHSKIFVIQVYRTASDHT